MRSRASARVTGSSRPRANCSSATGSPPRRSTRSSSGRGSRRARCTTTSPTSEPLYLGAYDAAHVRLAERIRELSVDGRGREPFEVFVDACAAFLESVVTEPWVVRLTVAEGPAALGNAEWRALDEGYAADTIGVPLQKLQARGAVRADVDVATATALINAAINEAALRVATAPDVSAELARTVPALRSAPGRIRARTLNAIVPHRRHLVQVPPAGSPHWPRFPPESAEQLDNSFAYLE